MEYALLAVVLIAINGLTALLVLAWFVWLGEESWRGKRPGFWRWVAGKVWGDG